MWKFMGTRTQKTFSALRKDENHDHAAVTTLLACNARCVEVGFRLASNKGGSS